MTGAPARAWITGVPIEASTMRQALERCEQAIRSRSRLLVGVVNAAKLVHMRSDQRLREAVLAADAIYADGMSVVWAGRLTRQPLPERVAGIDLMTGLLQRGDRNGYRVFFLGAEQAVLDVVLQRVAAETPGVQIAGSRNGYFSDDEERGVAEQIRAARPDILFAAMSSPKKELFLARWAGMMQVPVCHGVGGAFDVLAGKVRRAPERWQRLGLEWLYRTAQEPGRLWKRYLITNTLFTGMVLREAIFGRAAPYGITSSHPPTATGKS